MTYERITVVLTDQEMSKVRKLAQQELRRPRDQIAYMVKQVLEGNPISGYQPEGQISHDQIVSA